MKKTNFYYLIGGTGLILNLAATIILSYTVDPYFASIFSFFFPVWIMLLVVGYRKAHPRR